jgi:hypothetical protein
MGWLFQPSFTIFPASFELQDFLVSLKHGYSRERLERAEPERQHRLTGIEPATGTKFGQWPTKWTGFGGSAYLQSGMKWFLLLLRSRKWGLAAMMLLWLRQVLHEVTNYPSKEVREFWHSRLARAWEANLLKFNIRLAEKEAGERDEASVIDALREVYQEWAGRLYQIVEPNFVRDRYGTEWLLLGKVQNDLLLSQVDKATWDKWLVHTFRNLTPEADLDFANDDRLDELRLILPASKKQVALPVKRERYPSLSYAVRQRSRADLEAFRVEPEKIPLAGGARSWWARDLDQLDWLDGLNELELFEAALGERAFPVLGIPGPSALSRAIQEQHEAEGKKRKQRTKNGGGIGVGSLALGAALGAVAVAAWRRRAA